VREKKVVPVIAELVPTEVGTVYVMVSQQVSVVVGAAVGVRVVGEAVGVRVAGAAVGVRVVGAAVGEAVCGDAQISHPNAVSV
jgi:hypothetical protein